MLVERRMMLFVVRIPSFLMRDNSFGMGRYLMVTADCY